MKLIIDDAHIEKIKRIQNKNLRQQYISKCLQFFPVTQNCLKLSRGLIK